MAFDINQILKDNALIITISGASTALFTWTGMLKGPLADFWKYTSLITLGAGLYGFYLAGGIPGVATAQANYAYPNFYPYGHPYYYLHLDSPDVENNYGAGFVDVPRISNALNAQVKTGNYQHTSGNPAYESNHIYSYIQDEY